MAKHKSRAARLSEAVAEAQGAAQRIREAFDTITSEVEALGDYKSVVEELQEEMQNWYDNMSENLQQSEKAGRIQAAAEALQEIVDKLGELEDVDATLADNVEEALEMADSVEFVGMYG